MLKYHQVSFFVFKTTWHHWFKIKVKMIFSTMRTNIFKNALSFCYIYFEDRTERPVNCYISTHRMKWHLFPLEVLQSCTECSFLYLQIRDIRQDKVNLSVGFYDNQQTLAIITDRGSLEVQFYDRKIFLLLF